MKCPECQSDVPESADHCFNCGHVLRAQPVLIRGSMIAGRFEVLAPLGKGGMGMVYKAKDHKLEEVVAIKVLRPDIAADPDMERRFRREIRLARKVRHRNVCAIHEYGDDGPLRYIAMEYVEGVDLRRLVLESGGLPLEEAFDTCIHTAEGLQAIHDAGIVHRDLKTANLMRDMDGVVRLMDFGIAKQVDKESATATATGLVVGTPEYMSPEQARAGRIDHRTDIYALGIVAYELFTGRVPFRGETPLATIFMHLQDPPPLEGPGAEGLPPPVVPVLRKALAKDPEERFSSAAEFASAIAEARDAAGVPPLARRRSARRLAAGVTIPRTMGAAAAPLPSPTLETLEPWPTLEARSGPTVASPTAPPTRALEPSRVEAARLRDLPPKRKTLVWAGIAGGLLLVVAGGVALLRAPSPPSPTPASTAAAIIPLPPSATAAPSLAPAAPKGTLVIDALPWGEVVGVVDASGRHHEPADRRYTPLAIALPPGTYKVELRNPGVAEPLTRTATVRSEAVETVSVVFRRIGAQDYLQKTGF